MTSAHALGCDGIWRYTDTYLDGEFGEVERAEFEAHVETCDACRVIVREQSAWRRAVRDAAPRERAPAELRARIEAAIADPALLATLAPSSLPPPSPEGAEGSHASALDELATKRARGLVERAWPYAAAAAVVLALVVTRGRHAQVTADVIAKHQRNLPLEVTGRSDEVRRWYADKVDFPVHPPSFGAVHQPALRGGRLANVRERQAAYLQYDLDGNKVSVFIFDPGEMPIEASHHEMIGNRDVYFDAERGYNVALYRDHGIGYAIAADMNQGDMMKLVSAAVSH